MSVVSRIYNKAKRDSRIVSACNTGKRLLWNIILSIAEEICRDLFGDMIVDAVKEAAQKIWDNLYG